MISAIANTGNLIERLRAVSTTEIETMYDLTREAAKRIDQLEKQLLQMQADLIKRNTDYGLCRAALGDLVWAIDKRWNGESERKRSNAISPMMESRLANARDFLISK